MDVIDIQMPSIDRPFGIHLWPLFDAAWTKVIGYPAMDFRFEQGVTPISTLKTSLAIIVTYYAVIFGGREIMRPFNPVKLRLLFQIHNFFLTALSGALLALFIEQLAPTLWRGGIFYGICNREGGWTQPLLVLYYVCRTRQARMCKLLILTSL